MNLTKWALIGYCLAIIGSSLLDSIAGPSRESLINGVTILTMATVLTSIFLRKRTLLIIMPIYAVFYTGYSLAKTGSFFYATGQVVGLSLPLLLAYFIYRSMEEREIPSGKMKNLRYLRTGDLSKEQMNNELEKLGLDFLKYGEVFLFVIDPGEWYKEVRLYPKTKKAQLYSHSPDYDAINTKTFDYSFDNEKIMMRLLENKSKYPGSVEYSVRDRVVMEQSIRVANNKNIFSQIFESTDEKIAKLKSMVEWHEFKDLIIKYFIMSHHPEVYPPLEFRHLLRKDLEHLRVCTDRFISKASSLGVSIKETKEGFTFEIPPECDSQIETQIRTLFSNESLNKFDISLNNLNNLKEIESRLLEFLGETNYKSKCG
jgi:hypothetical protein